MEAIGKQRLAPPLFHHGLWGLQATWPLREEKEVTDATEAMICGSAMLIGAKTFGM